MLDNPCMPSKCTHEGVAVAVESALFLEVPSTIYHYQDIKLTEKYKKILQRVRIIHINAELKSILTSSPFLIGAIE